MNASYDAYIYHATVSAVAAAAAAVDNDETTALSGFQASRPCMLLVRRN